MRHLLIVAALYLMLPNNVNSSDFRIILGVNSIMEVRGDQTTFVQTLPVAAKLYNILVKQFKLRPDRAMTFARAFAATEHPYELLVMCHMESEFDEDATGASGEKGCMQVIASDWGPVPVTIEGQIKQADSILKELIAQHGRVGGVMAYNGTGAKAMRYAGKVLSKTAAIRG